MEDASAILCAQLIDGPLQHFPFERIDSTTAVRQWIKEQYELSEEKIQSQSHAWSDGNKQYKPESESWTNGQAEYWVSYEETPNSR